MKSSNRLVLLMLLLATAYLSGCAASGNHFTQPAAAPADKAAIYFYRPKEFAGSALNIAVMDNGSKITSLVNGQFTRVETSAGKHRFNTDTMAIDKPTDMETEAGKIYYVRLGLRMGAWTSTWYLSRVFDEEALDELAKCCKDGK